MHHIHISTGFMFVVAFFIVALLAVIFTFIVKLKQTKAMAKIAEGRSERNYAPPSSGDYLRAEREAADSRRVNPWGPMAQAQQNYHTAAAAPAYHPAPVYHSNNDMLTGLLIGEAIAGGHHHDTTVIHDSSPSHSSSYSSSSDYSSPSSDSGFSYSDSSSSYDSGSSGGLDIG